MGKNKNKLHFPQQCTENIRLKSVELRWGVPANMPSELIAVQKLIEKRKLRKAFRLVEEIFQKNPYALSVRIRYADMLLLGKKKDRAIALFNGKRDLAEAFPEENWFAIEEYLAFLSFLGHLALFEKKYYAAEEYHYLMYKLAPDDIRTKLLAKKLRKKSYLLRLLNAFRTLFAVRGRDQISRGNLRDVL